MNGIYQLFLNMQRLKNDWMVIHQNISEQFCLGIEIIYDFLFQMLYKEYVLLRYQLKKNPILS